MRPRHMTLLIITLLGGTVAACDAGEPGETTSPTPSACFTGEWEATAVTGQVSIPQASLELTGGSGTLLSITPDGQTTLRFDAMQPITFTAALLGALGKGQYQYHGMLRGAVDTAAATGDSGPWRPTGTVDWSQLQLTLRLTDPIDLTLLDKARLSKLPGDAQSPAGDAVDLQPLLREGTYRCEGDALTISPEKSGPTLNWAFSRR